MAERYEIVAHPFTVAHIEIKAQQLCRRADFSKSDFDDLCQDMRIYLMEKSHLLDPDRGCLEAFVTKTIKTWVAMRLRYHKRTRRNGSHMAISLEGTLVVYQGEIKSLGAVLLEEDGHRLTRIAPMSAMDRLELRDALDVAMQHLTANERALLHEVAENGIEPTAKSRGVSTRQIGNSLARIRQRIEKTGIFEK